MCHTGRCRCEAYSCSHPDLPCPNQGFILGEIHLMILVGHQPKAGPICPGQWQNPASGHAAVPFGTQSVRPGWDRAREAGSTGLAPSYLSDEDDDDRVLLLLLRELGDEGAEGVCQVGVHLPLHAGDSHHDGHCPGPRRDFREGVCWDKAFLAVPVTASWFSCLVPGSIIKTQRCSAGWWVPGLCGAPVLQCPSPVPTSSTPVYPSGRAPIVARCFQDSWDLLSMHCPASASTCRGGWPRALPHPQPC